MNPDEEKVREIIACQAGEWVAAHQAGGLDAAERRAFYAWLIASPWIFGYAYGPVWPSAPWDSVVVGALILLLAL